MTNGISVDELVGQLKQRGERLPFEIGAFVALEACEASLERPVKLQAQGIQLSSDGFVLIDARAEPVAAPESAGSVLQMLASLLAAAGPEVPPKLLELVGEAREGSWDLERIRDEIAASLIPLNRGASRRVIARLVRESTRPPVGAAHRATEEELLTADAALDELLGEPLPAVASGAPAEPPAADVVGPPEIAPPPTEPLPTGIRPRSSVGGRILFLVVALGGLAYLLTRGVPTSEPQVAAPAVAPPTAAARVGTVAISVTPADAQVFVYLGRSPVTAQGLTPGEAHEFIAFGDTGAPSRAAVPADAEWAEQGDRYVYTLTLDVDAQDDARMRFGAPIAPPPSDKAGQADVRVVTRPAGLKVYRYLGTGPKLDVSRLSIDVGHELLIFSPGHVPYRVIAGPSDWQPGPDGYSASVDVTLPPLQAAP